MSIYRCLNVWHTDIRFRDIVKQKWEEYKIQANGMWVVKEKFKRLKHELKIWNKEVFGYTGKLKIDIIRRIGELDSLDDESNLDEKSKVERIELLSQLRVLNLKNESLLQQKFRTKWIAYGDTNSKFFHSYIKWRSLMNNIKGLEVLGQWSEEPEIVKEAVREFYVKRLTATPDSGVRLDNIHFQQITEEDNKMLINVFDENEIKEAVWECGSNKSPGPDGFNFSFIKKILGCHK